MVSFSTLAALSTLALATAADAAFNVASEFQAFKVKYGRNYQSVEEEGKALRAFANNLKMIESWNSKPPKIHDYCPKPTQISKFHERPS